MRKPNRKSANSKSYKKQFSKTAKHNIPTKLLVKPMRGGYRL